MDYHEHVLLFIGTFREIEVTITDSESVANAEKADAIKAAIMKRLNQL